MASFQEVVADVTPSRWVVHKFGGTSVGSADCMRKCVDIIRPLTSIQRVAVVVSAMGGKPKVTDLLLDLVHSAVVGRKEEIALKMDLIRTKHRECVADILGKTPEIHQQIMGMIDSDLRDITDLLKAVALMKMAHEQILELVSGYGELWSATILAAVMRQEGMPFKFLNARDVLFVNELNKVCWEESGQKLAAFLEAAEAEFADAFLAAPSTVPKPHLLITGYVASTLEGVATTLKRDGSDYSASIFGKMLRATTITIWTDVSGVFSADPRRVPEAQILPEVSYTEAIELAYFGAKVIHPKT
jgi:aspartokinase/homoserine dehydrogenase 1